MIPDGLAGGPYHSKRGLQKSNTGQEIEEWLKEALREDPELQLAPMYQSDRELVEYIKMLREEVAAEKKMEGFREGEKQKVVG